MTQRRLCKVRILSHRGTVEPLLEGLQAYGAFHPVAPADDREGLTPHANDELLTARDRLDHLSRAIELLEPHRLKGSFLDEMLAPPAELDHDDRERLLKDGRPFRAADEILTLATERANLEKEAETLATRAEALGPWAPLTITGRRLKASELVRFEAGLIAPSVIDDLRRSLAEAGSHWDLVQLVRGDTSPQTPVIFACLVADASLYLPHLNEAGFQEFRLPDEFPPAREAKRLLDRSREITLEAEARTKRLAARVRELPSLRLAWDETQALIRRLEGEGRGKATRSTVVIEGWIPETDFPDLKHRVEGLTTTFIEKTAPAPGETRPVELENGAFASPFEVVTDLYARPQPGEFDPTPYLAPFFAIYFGICLTDAGYGLVLLLLCALVIRKLRPSGGTRKLLMTLGICGASTIVLGTATGGFFAMESAKQFIQSHGLMVFDPMADQMFFFSLVLVFGVVQVGFGYLLKAWWNVSNNKTADAIFDQASWLLILGGGFTMALGAMQWGGGMMILGGIIILLFAGRENENVFLRLASGLYALYGITGLFGDVLSYSRLLALGIATGVIAGVVNTIAGMALGMPYGLGVVAALAILILGHAANIAINCMGAFVHTVRLQFVEFFTKFYEGGGEPFRPLADDRRFTVVRQRKARP